MNDLAQAEKILPSLSRTEKFELLGSLVRELGQDFPGIDSRPDICGGDVCVIRTRIPIWLLENARRLGTSEADLLRSYPSLRPSDLASAWAYVGAHVDEINRQIQANEAA